MDFHSVMETFAEAWVAANTHTPLTVAAEQVRTVNRDGEIDNFPHTSGSKYIPLPEHSEHIPSSKYSEMNNIKNSSCPDSAKDNNDVAVAQSTLRNSGDKIPCQVKKNTTRRWKKAKPETWKCNVAKKRRSQCLPYTTKRGEMAAKVPKDTDCRNCRFKCSDNFSEEDRKDICTIFWGLDYNRQKDFIIRGIRVVAPARRCANASKPRAESRQYFLRSSRGEFRVCSKYFQNTLSISNGPINNALSCATSSGTFAGGDHRGRKHPPNKTTSTDVSPVKEHK